MRAKILSASAGSGKTFRLAYKFVHDTIRHYPEKPYLYRAILAVTFTNKATREMKSRILEKMNDLVECPLHSDYMDRLKADLGLSQQEISRRAGLILRRILHDYSRFAVFTIDKFFQSIMRSFVKELNLEINYNIEIDSSSILTQSTDSLIEEIASNEELRKWIMEFARENSDNALHWDIRRQILELGGEIFKEDSREALLSPTPREALRRIIATTEDDLLQTTSQMQAEAIRALQIISDAGLQPSDFDGKSRSFVYHFVEVARSAMKAPTKSIRDKVVATSWSKNGVAQSLVGELQPILAYLCDTYDKMISTHNTLSIVKARYRSYALLQDIYRKVCLQCDKEGVMLLSETKHILSHFIMENDAPFIYEKVGNRFERFMIDEFQDTSLREWQNFVPLLRNAMSQEDDESVLIVGDVKQSIYRWRGGDWRILAEGVERDLGAEDVECEFMKDNWRSLPCVVEFNNRVIESIVESENEELNTLLREAVDTERISTKCYNDLKDTLKRAYEQQAQTPRKRCRREGYVRVERFEEQPPVIRTIESAIERGYRYNDIMILHRSKSDEAATAQLLLQYKQEKGLSFNVMTQESLIVGNSLVCQFIIAILRLSQAKDDRISLAVVNNYLSHTQAARAFDQELSDDEISFLTHISSLSPDVAFEKIVQRYTLDNRAADIAYLQALHEQVITFCASKIADIQLFLAEWDERGHKKALTAQQSDDTIELLTIHKAKGLEKPIVIIPYCNWTLRPHNDIVWAKSEHDKWSEVGTFPVYCSTNMGESAYSEEYWHESIYSHVDAINMLYVALTRAGEELYVFIPTQQERRMKNVGEILFNSINSDAENGEWVEYGEPGSPEQKKEALQECRECEKQTRCRKHRKKSVGTNNVLLEKYPSQPLHDALHLATQRYFEERADGLATQRDIGIMMHSILCEADNIADIDRCIDNAYKAGELSDEQADTLRSTIEREFAREEIREWFDTKWDMVRREQDILSQSVVGTRRPDRVMIKGSRAVVVDYKFGSERYSSHRKQMAIYMQLLRDMGYCEVEGYLWYMTLGKVERIE